MAHRVPPAIALAALAVLAVAALLSIAAPHAGAQTIVPEVRVELDEGQDRQTATVTDLAGDPDITFAGTITVTRLVPINPVTVNPGAFVENADARWKVTPNPSKLTFNGSGSLPFSIVISAPANLSAGATFKVNFNASVTGLLYYNIIPDAGFIEVLQYYKLGHFASSEVIHIKQDASKTLNFTVQNRGNGDDTVSIALGNEAELGLRGITVLYETTMRLEPWQSAKISFILTADIDAEPGDAKFNFTIKSAGSGDRVTASVEFSLVVEKSPIRNFLIRYWWVVVVGVVVLAILLAVLGRRRRRRRADEEALAGMQLAPPAKRAVPPKARARKRGPTEPTEGVGGPEGPPEGSAPAGEDEAEGSGAGEVTIGHG